MLENGEVLLASRPRFIFLMALMFSSLSGWATPMPISLDGAYRAALKKSETLNGQEKQVQVADERRTQARASILPELLVRGSYLVQDQPNDPLALSFFPRTQPEAKLTLRQPVFRGLREFAALHQFASLSRAERHTWSRAALLLYSEVAQSYHDVLAREQDLKNLQDQLQLYDERIGELKDRVRAGTSNVTDQLTMQSSRAGIRSQLDLARGSLTAARERFVFLTGMPAGTELVAIKSSPPKPEAVEKYLAKIEERPDFLDAQERARAADDSVAIERGAHFPTIDLEANYYFKRPSVVYNGINWDVQAVASIPLFSGGGTSSRVRTAALGRERAELEVTRIRRQAEEEVRTLHSNYLAALDSIAALEEGLQLAEKNYQLLKKDYRRGLARILDVQQALTASLEARRALANNRFNARNTWIQLEIASGRHVAEAVRLE